MAQEMVHMKKVFFAIAAVFVILLTAWVTYRVVMRNLEIEVTDDATYITVFGMTDEYNF